MKFWSSSETSTGVPEEFNEIRRATEIHLNGTLSETQLEAKWNGWTWTFIAIILAPDFENILSERILCSKKRKDFEFRLKIDFGAFLAADRNQRVYLVFEQLHRSVDLMAKYSVNQKDRDTLHQILKTVSDEINPSQ